MNKKAKRPKWYWLVSIAATLWYGNSVMNFIVKECQWGNLILGETVALGIYGITGFLASIFLLLKKTTAYIGFVISFVAMLIQQSYCFMYRARISPTYMILTLVLSLIMIITSRTAKKKGWIAT